MNPVYVFILPLGFLNIFVYEGEGSSSLLGHVEVSQPKPVWNSLTICPPRSVKPRDRFMSVLGTSGVSFAVEVTQSPSEIMLDIPQTVNVKSGDVIVFPFNPPKDILDRQLDITVTSKSNIPAYLKVSQIREDVEKNIEVVDYKKESLRLSFAKRGRITLSKVSVPPLTDSTSSWFIGIALKDATGEPSESKHVTLKLSQSFDYSYAGPICALFFVSLLGGIAVSIIALLLFKESLVVVNTPDALVIVNESNGGQDIQPSNGQENSNNPPSNTWLQVIIKFLKFILAMLKVAYSYWFSGGPKTYSYVTGIVGFVLMIGACQFVIANWYIMIQEGDRDDCYYNDLCYRVSDYHDIPFNLMISNLAYIIHALILTVCVLYMETELYLSCEKLQNSPTSSASKGKQNEVLPNHVFVCPNITPHLLEGLVPKHTFRDKEKEKFMAFALKRKYSYSIGYAFAWALLFEGLFSLIYHLCPSRYTFQFDSAFMFVIASLTVLLLYNGMELNECPVYQVEQHPEKQHPVEEDHLEERPGEQHPVDQHPVEAHSVIIREQHPIKQDPVEKHQVEQDPREQHLAEAHSVEQQPEEQHSTGRCSTGHPVEEHQVEQHPGEQHLVETHSVGQQPVEQHPTGRCSTEHPVEELPVGALNFFLYFIVPLFIFNYLGTLYHSESGLAKALQGLFFAFLIIWWLAMGFWVFHKLKLRKGVLPLGTRQEKTGELYWNAFYYIVGFFIVPPALFVWLFLVSDLSQAFLFTCIVETIFAVSAKAKLIQKLFALVYPWKCPCMCTGWFSCKCTCNCSAPTLKEIFQGCYILFTGCVLVGAVSVFLALPTTDKTASPEDSRDLNKECKLFGFFDWHDLWHFLSSFALLMGAFVIMFVSAEPGQSITNSSRVSGNTARRNGAEISEIESRGGNERFDARESAGGHESVDGNGMAAGT